MVGCLKKPYCRLLTSVCWLSISWYRLDACTQFAIKIHQITNVQVLINVKKVEMKNDALQMHFLIMILAASLDKNWIPVDEKLLPVDKSLIPVTDNLIPVDALWMSVDKKLLPVTVKLDTGC